MCGISGILGPGFRPERLRAMVDAQVHRGPDDRCEWTAPAAGLGLGHNRLSILDLSPAGRQPMATPDGRFRLVLNGEIYNYVELRRELADYPFRTRTDTEVALAALARWGEAALDRFHGMFALVCWDDRRRRLLAARDRFGVKPLHVHVEPDGTVLLASEIKALHAAGVAREPDEEAWAAWLVRGRVPVSARTFWAGVRPLPAGSLLTVEDGRVRTRRWYDLAARVGPDLDARPEPVVEEEYAALLRESVALRFRADVPVGVNLSGGLDSSTLLGLVHAVQGPDSDVAAFTFVTGDARYDELPWVERMLARTRHPLRVCRLRAEEVPELARSVQQAEDEPFGGIPTLAYARLFERARDEGVTVLLDGQGMDEQWAGYDYYRGGGGTVVQGTRTSPLRPACLDPLFRARAGEPEEPAPFADRLRNLQLRDLCSVKLPRALRFNDRASMRASRELREPFLDHRLVELALRQPPDRKIRDGQGKWLLRRIAARLAPGRVVEAPKRPLQTPQREWLRGPLRAWVADGVESLLGGGLGAWFDGPAVRAELDAYLAGEGDNSFFVWQWLSASLAAEQVPA